MAKSKKEIFVDVVITSSESKKEVIELQKEIDKLNKKLKETETSGGEKGEGGAGGVLAKIGTFAAGAGASLGALVSPLALVAVGMAALKAGRVVADYLMSAAAAADEANLSMLKLEQALRANGSYSPQAMKEFTALGDSIEKMTGLSGEAVIESVALAKQMGASNVEAKALTQAAANLAGTFGGDLNSRTVELGKAMNGNLGKLGQMIPELRNLTKEQLASGAAADIINKKFSEGASGMMTDYSRSLFSITKGWDDVKKAIGGFITDSSALQSLFKTIGGALDSVAEKIEEYKTRNGEAALSEEKRSVYIEENRQRYRELEKQMEALNNRAYSGIPMIDGWMNSFDASRAKSEMESLNQELAAIVSRPGEMAVPGIDNKKNAPVIDESVINNKKMLNAEILRLNEEQAIAEAEQAFNLKVAQDEAALISREEQIAQEEEFFIGRLAAEYEFEMARIAQIEEASVRRAEIAKLDADQQKKIGDFRNKQELDNVKAKNQAIQKLEMMKMQAMAGYLSQGAELANNILKAGSKEQFIVSKAFGLAQIWNARSIGMANALLIPDPTPTQSLRAAAIAQANITAGLAAANLAASSIKFKDGGFTGKVSGNSFRGDKVPAMLNSDEWVLNQRERGVIQGFLGDSVMNNAGGMNSELLASIERKVGMPAMISMNGVILTEEINRINNARLT